MARSPATGSESDQRLRRLRSSPDSPVNFQSCRDSQNGLRTVTRNDGYGRTAIPNKWITASDRPEPENPGSDSDKGGALVDGDLEIAAHAHALHR